MSDKKYWVAMIKVNESYYLACSKKGEINSRDSEQEMLNLFTYSYMGSSCRSVQGNTSAQLHIATFQPSIINMGIEEMGEKLFDLKKGVSPEKHSSHFGGMTLLPCNTKDKSKIEKIFESGSKPKFSLF